MTATVERMLAEALRLSPDERQELIEALCEAVVRAKAHPEPPAWHLEILEERLRESSGDPSELIPADQVYEELLTKLRGKKP